jgi:WD40 repeat protein
MLVDILTIPISFAGGNDRREVDSPDPNNIEAQQSDFETLISRVEDLPSELQIEILAPLLSPIKKKLPIRDGRCRLQRKQLLGHNDVVSSVSFSPSGETIASGS